MRHIVTMVRQGQAEDASVQIRQQQVGNFVAPTLADLELLVWANDHGGLVSCSNNKYSMVPERERGREREREREKYSMAPALDNVHCSIVRVVH